MSDGRRFLDGAVSILTVLVFLSTPGALRAQSVTSAATQQSGRATAPSGIVHHSAEANGVKYHFVVTGQGRQSSCSMAGPPPGTTGTRSFPRCLRRTR